MNLMSKKLELCGQIKASGNKPTLEMVAELIDEVIAETRVSNDTAFRHDVLKNQGGIMKLKELKSLLGAQA